MKVFINNLLLIAISIIFFTQSCSTVPEEFELIQSKPILTYVDIGLPGISHGDMLI